MKAEEVDVSEVVGDGWGEIILVDLIEDEVKVSWDGGDVGLHQVDEDVDGVGVHPSAFIATGMEDGGTDVAREGIGLGGGWFGRVVMWGDWLGV